MLAALLGWSPMPFFAVEDGESDRPEMELRPA